MLIMILCSVIAGVSGTPSNFSGIEAVRAADIRSQDIQDVAIKSITGKPPAISSAGLAEYDRSVSADPQSEIVDRISGRNIHYPKTNVDAGNGSDMQSGIVRSISGRN
ncbi:MAG: hypothetical protein V4472_16780 [Pseudomonadota bacterium]